MSKHSLDWDGALPAFGFQARGLVQSSWGQEHDALRKGSMEGQEQRREQRR